MDDHRSGKIVVDLIGRINKCGVISPRFDVCHDEIEQWVVNLLPALEEWQVTLYLSGHDHCYQRFGPSEKLPVPLVVSGGGGKRLYDITDNPRARREAQALEKAHHWCGVEVEGDTLRWTATSIDGEVLDDVTMRLPEGEDLERLRARSPQRAARIEALQKGR